MNDIPFNDNENNNDWVYITGHNDEINADPVILGTDTVPNVKGMNVTDAVYLLESMGWNVNFSGLGKVKTQSPKAETELSKGKTINLTLSLK